MSALNMVPQLVLAALALACLGVASEPNCTELVKPLADRGSVFGKWIYHAGTSDSEEVLAMLRNTTSSWFHISRIFDATPTIMEFADKIDGKCIYTKGNLIGVGDRTIMDFVYGNLTYIYDGQYLETCPDCLMWTDVAKAPGSAANKNLYIFTRTGNLSLHHLEEFKQQAACLNFTLGFHMASNTDLCPEKKEEKEDE